MLTSVFDAFVGIVFEFRHNKDTKLIGPIMSATNIGGKLFHVTNFLRVHGRSTIQEFDKWKHYNHESNIALDVVRIYSLELLWSLKIRMCF